MVPQCELALPRQASTNTHGIEGTRPGVTVQGRARETAMSRHHGGWADGGALAVDDILQWQAWSGQQSPSAEMFGGSRGEHEQKEFAGRPETFQSDPVGTLPLAVFRRAGMIWSRSSALRRPTAVRRGDQHDGRARPYDQSSGNASGGSGSPGHPSPDQFDQLLRDPRRRSDRPIWRHRSNRRSGGSEQPRFLLCGCIVKAENILDMADGRSAFLMWPLNPTDPGRSACRGHRRFIRDPYLAPVRGKCQRFR